MIILFFIVFIICYCNVVVFFLKIDESLVFLLVFIMFLLGKCEYNGKYYDFGVIEKEKNGDCVFDVICMEGGVILIGDLFGCWGSMDKGRGDYYWF